MQGWQELTFLESIPESLRTNAEFERCYTAVALACRPPHDCPESSLRLLQRGEEQHDTDDDQPPGVSWEIEGQAMQELKDYKAFWLWMLESQWVLGSKKELLLEALASFLGEYMESKYMRVVRSKNRTEPVRKGVDALKVGLEDTGSRALRLEADATVDDRYSPMRPAASTRTATNTCVCVPPVCVAPASGALPRYTQCSGGGQPSREYHRPPSCAHLCVCH